MRDAIRTVAEHLSAVYPLLADSHTFVCRTWDDLAARLGWAREKGYATAKARRANGQLLERLSATAIDGRLYDPEDQTLSRGRRQDFPPAALALLGLGRLLLADDELPNSND